MAPTSSICTDSWIGAHCQIHGDFSSHRLLRTSTTSWVPASRVMRATALRRQPWIEALDTAEEFVEDVVEEAEELAEEFIDAAMDTASDVASEVAGWFGL